ncbi:MAG: hypothetical protein EPO16_06830 [Dehalococcoidia bacterium]|nr:MAG: hypothetical protein EPO16_06830 [Dehalococcoidia bacterium]
MVHVRGETVIRCAPVEVFDFVADERNEPLYNPEMTSVTQLTQGAPGVGTRYRAEMTSKSGPVTMLIEFTRYERPTLLQSHTSLSSMEIDGALTFEPVEGGTRLRWDWELQPRGVLRFAGPLVALLGRRREAAIWDGLRRYLETGRAGERPSSPH